MEAHGIDLKGKLYLELVASLPTWTSADERRIVYNAMDKKIYYASNSAWVDITSSLLTNPKLLALAEVTAGPNKLPYFTGTTSATVTDLSAFARTILDDVDAAAARSTLGLVIGTNVQAHDANTVKANVAQPYTAQQYALPVVLTGQSGTITLDADLHQDLALAATGNITFTAPSNAARGKTIFMQLYAGSALTITWNAVFKGNADFPALDSTFVAGKIMYLQFRCYDGTNWILMGRTQEA